VKLAVAVPGIEYIEAQDVRRSPFRVAVTPLPSLHAAVREAAGGKASGMSLAWSEAIRRQLTAKDHATLAPLATQGATLIPDPLVGLADPPGESLKDGIERMMATPDDALLAEIEECLAATRNEGWREAQRDPSRWLRRYVASLLRAWKGFGPIWRQARPALGREVERIGMSAALDAQLELLDGLLVDAGVDDGRWYCPCEFYEGRARFPEQGVVLMPLLGGERRQVLVRRGEVMETIIYPLRSLPGVAHGAPPSGALESLLGGPRAAILRALGCPLSIGRLAETLRSVPSAATHHVSALEAAGLVSRDRTGRHVLVRRTERGEALLALYEEVAVPFRRSSKGLSRAAKRG
jgi:DNA-binding transcriptional ArsR family regulator